MYLREKKTRRGDKTYSYWQVVQATRTPEGPRQTVVKHLGRLRSREDATVLARMWGVLCGADGCSEEGTVERIAHPIHNRRKTKRHGGPSFGGPNERSLLLCEKHAAELDAGATLMSVSLDREWRRA